MIFAKQALLADGWASDVRLSMEEGIIIAAHYSTMAPGTSWQCHYDR